MNLYAVILAGGRGKRFWPVSRKTSPKQFLPIVGNQPMIRQTVERISSVIPAERTLVVTSRSLRSELTVAIPELPESNMFLEPVGRNTAPAVAWTSLCLQRRDPEAVVAVLASDHVIGDETAFRGMLESAASLAWKDRAIVTLGIRPDRPETGYGYIKAVDQAGFSDRHVYYRVDTFVEKPDLPTAEKYLEQGCYFWNSGMFIFRADRMIDEMKRHQPAIYSGVSRIVDSGNLAETVDDLFPTLPDVSLDYGIIELTDRILMMPVEFPWADVGSWEALYSHLADGGDGNRIQPDQAKNRILLDSRNVMIHGGKRLIATIGLDDVIVVDTKDALLVCRRDRSQDVGKLMKMLEEHPDWKTYI
jgi:mannose-1-phosphate guanylyltransferase